MTRDEILACLDKAAGCPSMGVVHDILPTLADALDARLNPAPAKAEKRVIAAEETR